VLHVITEAYPTGGHTQNAWRWIEDDRARAHSVALTRQRSLPVPGPLTDAVAASGGNLTRLDRNGADLISRARHLAELAATFDEVVLHVHPFDILPLIAFGVSEERPPVVFVNHADHVFWLGVSVADVVVQGRVAAVSLCEQRRGIPRERTIVLPLPIHSAHPKPRDGAKRALGLDPGGVLLVTAASGYKYASGDQPSFTELVVPVLKDRPQARLIALGPPDAGMWAEARKATGGQLQAIGRRDDVRPYLGAADIYLDSTPFTSVSSLLEAGQHGLPLVRFSAAADVDMPLFEPNYPALEATVVTSRAADDYRRVLSELIDDPTLRTSVGDKVRQVVLERHSPGAFARSLEDIRRKVETLSRRHPSLPVGGGDPGQLDRQVEELHANSGVAAAFLPETRRHFGLIPRAQCASVALEVATAAARDASILGAPIARRMKRLGGR